MILIIRSTGHLGSATINYLLKLVPAEEIAAFVHDAEKAAWLKDKGVEVRLGDYNNSEALEAACQGIDKLLLISSSGMGDRASQHINVIDAAKQAGVSHIIYTSFQRNDESSEAAINFIADDHLTTEAHLKASGMNYTIFKNGFYLDMLPDFIGRNVLETGGIFLPAGEGKVSFTLRDNIAEALANILASIGHENKVYEIAPDTSYSFAEISDIMTKLGGKAITYTNISVENYKTALQEHQVPEMMIDMSAAFLTAFSQNEMNVPSDDLNQLLGHKASSVPEFLKQTYFPTNVPA